MPTLLLCLACDSLVVNEHPQQRPAANVCLSMSFFYLNGCAHEGQNNESSKGRLGTCWPRGALTTGTCLPRGALLRVHRMEREMKNVAHICSPGAPRESNQVSAFEKYKYKEEMWFGGSPVVPRSEQSQPLPFLSNRTLKFSWQSCLLSSGAALATLPIWHHTKLLACYIMFSQPRVLFYDFMGDLSYVIKHLNI